MKENVKQNLADFFGEPVEKKMNSKSGECGLPALLFKAMNDAHISHLLQQDKTMARHNAFSDFYTAVDGMLDTFTETYMGRYSLTSIVTEGSSVIIDPVSYFNNLYEQVTLLKAKYSGDKDGYLSNQIDELQQLIAHTLYKFKNIIT